MAGKSPTKSRPGKNKKRVIKDRHLLYSAAVQSTEADLDFFEKIYKKRNKRRFTDLKEDFCGTAVLSCEWIRRREVNRAWGVDLDAPTLEWGRKQYGPALSESEKSRLNLIEGNVLDVCEPKVDVVAALNFSFQVFHSRDLLGSYFEAARKSLKSDGVFILDCFGGQETFGELDEERKIASSKSWDGTKIPGFHYRWHQAKFNPIDHSILAKIHFRLKDGTQIKNAFVYEWRMWTLPELFELLHQAGFSSVEVYTEGWDEEEEDTDGIFRKRRYFENQASWIAYVVAYA